MISPEGSSFSDLNELKLFKLLLKIKNINADPLDCTPVELKLFNSKPTF